MEPDQRMGRVGKEGGSKDQMAGQVPDRPWSEEKATFSRNTGFAGGEERKF